MMIMMTARTVKQYFILYLLDFAIISFPLLVLKYILAVLSPALSNLMRLAQLNFSMTQEGLEQAKSSLGYTQLSFFLVVALAVFLVFYLFFIPIIRRFQYKRMVKKPLTFWRFYLISLLMPLIILGILYVFGTLFESSLPISLLTIYLYLFIFNLLNERRLGFKKKLFAKANLWRVAGFSLLHLVVFYILLKVLSINIYLFIALAPLIFLINRFLFLKYASNLLLING